MKRYFFKLSVLFIGLVFLFTHSIVQASLPLTGKTIVVDSGHGGLDPGTTYQKIYEKDINLAISLFLKTELENLGATVLLTRDGDYDLSKPNADRRKKSDFDNRIAIINKSKANYYVSIHLNYLPNPSYYGPQVFYNLKEEENKSVAEKIQNDLNIALHTKRSIRKIPSSTYMYSRLNIPGILIECGFLSNSYERNLLVKEEYQKKLATIIANSFSHLEF